MIKHHLISYAILLSTFLNPIAASHPTQHPLSTSTSGLIGENETWNLNFTSSAPHYFASVYGLLQQWSNTYFPFGHTIAPCKIPPLTKLYHGRRDGQSVPESPEWLSFDIGMAYGIMGSFRNSHILTFQTTRTVKCVYFDGESATLIGAGRMDTQMLQIYGNVSGPPRENRGFGGLVDEYDRARGLCDWIQEKELGGRGWGVEGFVRMNAGFEMIWCDFESGSLRLTQHTNVTAPLLPESMIEENMHSKHTLESSIPPTTETHTLHATQTKNPTEANPAPPPNFRHDAGREPFLRNQGWNWFVAGTAHYGNTGSGSGRGEDRIRLLTCGILNYYDPKYNSQAMARAELERKELNLTQEGNWIWEGEDADEEGRDVALKQLMRRRRLHSSLGDMSPEDAATMKADSERVLRDLNSDDHAKRCSGIDWSVLTNEIVQTYANPLSTLLQTLQLHNLNTSTESSSSAERAWISSIREQTHFLLLPFFEYPSTESNTNTEIDSSIWKRNSPLFKKTYDSCHHYHTFLLQTMPTLSQQERTLKWAVEETMSGICNVIVEVGLSVEGIWNSSFGQAERAERADGNEKVGSVEKAERDERGEKASERSYTQEITHSTHILSLLMSWLGWAGDWSSCDEKCGVGEKCYIPMWPMLGGVGKPGGGPEGGHGGGPGHGDGGPPGRGRDGHGPGRGGGHGDGREGVRGGGNGRRPGMRMDETDLWKPRCVGVDYIMGERE